MYIKPTTTCSSILLEKGLLVTASQIKVASGDITVQELKDGFKEGNTSFENSGFQDVDF